MTQEEERLAKERGLDGFVSRVMMPDGRVLGLKCEVIAVHPISCPKCGGTFELKYGEGICAFCGTRYSTRFYVEEV